MSFTKAPSHEKHFASLDVRGLWHARPLPIASVLDKSRPAAAQKFKISNLQINKSLIQQSMSNAIFEIFSEEIPATLQKKIAADYKQFAEKELKTLGITVKSEHIFVGITLNRLVLKLENAEITKQQLANFIDKTLKDFSKTFPRTMCYPQLEVRWLRPIRGLFACIDNQVLSGKFYGIELINGTHINKFDFVKCSGFDDYFSILAREQIEIDYQKRFDFVKSEIDNFAQKQGQEYRNTKLMEEIAGMSEYCTKPMVSTLDARFNVLPFELIELVLRENQRYVVFRPNDKKEIKFLIFGDKITAGKARDSIVRGHRKVVNARLDDALYYWQMDEGIKNDKAKLKSILSARTFIDDITWGNYLKKQEELAEAIIGNKATLEAVKQLIWDTKLDLATGVVAEFPELQGVIGAYYFKYKFNPYNLEFVKSCEDTRDYNKDECMQELENELEAKHYFTFIDRMTYILVMYQQGKQPTGSGDKYKVKARMDDVVSVVYSHQKNALLSIIREHTDIYSLFVKRYQKVLEDLYKNVEKIKQIAAVCAKLLDKDKIVVVDDIVAKIANKDFVKTFKRINGYVGNVAFVDNEAVKKKAEEITQVNSGKFASDYAGINDYLDNNKIHDNTEVLTALKWLDTMYNNELPSEFLELV